MMENKCAKILYGYTGTHNMQHLLKHYATS